MRALLFSLSIILSSVAVTSCISVTTLNQSLEKPHIDLAPGTLTKPYANISLPKGIRIDSILSPKGFPKESFAYKSGIFFLPLLVYNQFQTNFMITLGTKQFAKPIDESFRDRFGAMLASCENSSQPLDAPYILSMELQLCEPKGIFVQGYWASLSFYGSGSGEINHGRNASSIIRIRWEMSKEEETVATGDVFVMLKDPYLAKVAGYMINHGKRTELSKDNLNTEIPYLVEAGSDPYLNVIHINQIVQVLCLGLDKASEVILMDLKKYFSTEEKP